MKKLLYLMLYGSMLHATSASCLYTQLDPFDANAVDKKALVKLYKAQPKTCPLKKT